MATPAVRRADPLEALRTIQAALARKRLDEIPEGWRTSAQWAIAWGKSHGHTRALLREAVRGGIAERREFHTAEGTKAHYRVIS